MVIIYNFMMINYHTKIIIIHLHHLHSLIINAPHYYYYYFHHNYAFNLSDNYVINY
jgi:hypothetical protein